MAKYPDEYIGRMVSRSQAKSSYSKVLDPNFFYYMGRYARFTRYRKRLNINNDWATHLLQSGYNILENPYGYALGSFETGFKAISKYAQSLPKYNVIAYNKAEEMMHSVYSVVEKSGFCQNYLKCFDLTTSPGYPWCLKYRTKRDALGDPVIYQYIENFVASGGGECIAMNVCKAEPKKKAKIVDHDTRVISSLPMEMVAFGNYLFADQNEKIAEAARRGIVPTTVGRTKFFGGHEDLYRRMSKHPLGIECDFTAFDGSMDEKMIEMIMNLRFTMFHRQLRTPETQILIRNYYYTMQYTPIIMETGELYRKRTGNPSGQVNTIMDNNMVNEFRWYYAYALLHPSEDIIEGFTTNVELATCGDDSIVSVSKQCEYTYTPNKIGEIFEEHGWRTKFASTAFLPIHKLQYCSSHFGWYLGHVVPVPANKDKQIVSMYYGGVTQTPHETIARAMGIRMDSYFHVELCHLFESFISMMWNKYSSVLREPSRFPLEVGFKGLLAMNKSHAQLMDLYFGAKYGPYVFRTGAIKRFEMSFPGIGLGSSWDMEPQHFKLPHAKPDVTERIQPSAPRVAPRPPPDPPSSTGEGDPEEPTIMYGHDNPFHQDVPIVESKLPVVERKRVRIIEPPGDVTHRYDRVGRVVLPKQPVSIYKPPETWPTLDAEQLSHAFAGENARSYESFLSHGLGYGAYPLYRFMNWFIKKFPRSEQVDYPLVYRLRREAQEQLRNRYKPLARGRQSEPFRSPIKNSPMPRRRTFKGKRTKKRSFSRARRGRGGRRRRGGRGGRRVPRSSRGPAVTNVRKTKPMNVGIRKIRARDSSVMAGSVPIGTLGFDSSNNPTSQSMAGSEFGGQFYLQPSNSFYFPTIITNTAKQFRTFVFIKHWIRVEPRFGTQTNAFIFHCYFGDSESPEVLGAAGSNQFVAANTIKASSNCTQAPAYMRFQCPNKGVHKASAWFGDFEKLTASTTINARYDTGAGGEVNRRCTQGVYVFYPQGNPTPGVASTLCDLYFHFVVSFKQMTAVQTVLVALDDQNDKKMRVYYNTLTDNERKHLILNILDKDREIKMERRRQIKTLQDQLESLKVVDEKDKLVSHFMDTDERKIMVMDDDEEVVEEQAKIPERPESQRSVSLVRPPSVKSHSNK